MPKRSPALRAARGANVFLGKSVQFTIGDETLDVINIDMQVLDADGKPTLATGPFALRMWFSDDPDGLDIAAAGPSAGVAEGGRGVMLVEEVVGIMVTMVTDANGRVDVDATEVGALTLYLNVILEDRVFTSPAITWAA